MSLSKSFKRKQRAAPGASPGTLILTASAKPTRISVISYGKEFFTERQDVKPGELQEYLKRPDTVTWIDVKGLGNEGILRELAALFKIHPLALEDVVHTHQRPKADEYDEHLFIALRVLSLRARNDMHADQIGIFLGRNYVLTFEEEGSAEHFNPIRERLRRKAGIHRRLGADYLCYSIIDTAVDKYFPVLEAYGEYLEDLEDRTITHPVRQTLADVHRAKRELLDLRRVIWPQRDMVNQLIRMDTALISAEVRIFLRDCYDHSVQVMDMVETYREITSGLHDVYLSSLGQRTNEIMKVLTIISTIFIPLTFIAGVYGMNFDPDKSPWNMPELRAYYGYPVTMGIMLLIGLALVYYFWRKGWVFQGREVTPTPPDAVPVPPFPPKQ